MTDEKTTWADLAKETKVSKTVKKPKREREKPKPKKPKKPVYSYTSQEDLVIEVLRNEGPLSDREIAELIGIQQTSIVRARNTLLRLGIIKFVEKKLDKVTRRKTSVWRLV